MRLYGFWRSSATWRVRIALAHKGLAYEYVPVDLRSADGGEQHAPGYAAINPMRQVPVLELGPADASLRTRLRLTQSMAILEMLEEVWPDPPLLPADPALRAHVREIAELVNAGIQPLQNTGVQQYVKDALRADDQAWVRHWVGRGLVALESLVAPGAGKYAVGDEVTYADACIVPQLYFGRRFGLVGEAHPTLTRIERACEALPAFRAAHGEAQPDAPRPPG